VLFTCKEISFSELEVVLLGPSTSLSSSAVKYLLICHPRVTIRPRVCSSSLSSSSRSLSSPCIRVSTRVEGGELKEEKSKEERLKEQRSKEEEGYRL
jgi:hypothetical protein